MTRKSIPRANAIKVLTEAGYRCAVPTCRTILAIDLHHIIEVAKGGGNEPDNLIALCPNCHALYHRGVIHSDSVHAWKMMLTSLTRAFDLSTVDDLIFLSMPESNQLELTSDGVLRFIRIIASGLAALQLSLLNLNGNHYKRLYRIILTAKGNAIVKAWKEGDRSALSKIIGDA